MEVKKSYPIWNNHSEISIKSEDIQEDFFITFLDKKFVSITIEHFSKNSDEDEYTFQDYTSFKDSIVNNTLEISSKNITLVLKRNKNNLEVIECKNK